MKKALKSILVILLIIYFAYCVRYLLRYNHNYQWDFRITYNVAKLFAEGINPYDILALEARSGTSFAYPPATLWFYRLFTLAEYDTAYKIFLILKLAVFFSLVLLWRMKFVTKAGPGFYFFVLLAFNSAIFLDLRAGNINMLEELMLWLGFCFFLKNRLLPFCCFVLLAASFKLAPAVFLLLTLATDNKKRFVFFFSSCAVFLGYFLIQYAVAPEMFLGFLGEAKDTLAERGILSPSTIGAIESVYNCLTNTDNTSMPKYLKFGLLSVISVAILSVTGMAYRVLKSCKTEDKQKILLFIACLSYVMIHPRMKDYAYVLLIVPSYFIIKRTSYSKIYPFLFALSVLSSANVTLPGLKTIYSIMWSYFPLLIAYLMWGLYLYEIFVLTKQPAESQTPATSILPASSERV
jgi:hypothetical protein